MKYCPTFSHRFDDFEHVRAFCRDFLAHYNDEHRRSGIAYLIPADVHHGRAAEVLAERQAVMDAAVARNSELQTNPSRFR